MTSVHNSFSRGKIVVRKEHLCNIGSDFDLEEPSKLLVVRWADCISVPSEGKAEQSDVPQPHLIGRVFLA